MRLKKRWQTSRAQEVINALAYVVVDQNNNLEKTPSTTWAIKFAKGLNHHPLDFNL
jgi:hypothetical protein